MSADLLGLQLALLLGLADDHSLGLVEAQGFLTGKCQFFSMFPHEGFFNLPELVDTLMDNTTLLVLDYKKFQEYILELFPFSLYTSALAIHHISPRAENLES